MSEYTLKTGQYLTLEYTPTDADGNAVDTSSGYLLTATVKESLSVLDAEASVHVNSTDDSDRFTLAATTATVQVLLSSETEALTPGKTYYYDVWARNSSTGQNEYLGGGAVTIADSVTDSKS